MSLATLQKQGQQRLAALGTPSTRAEEWRYVALRDFGSFQPADTASVDAAAAVAEQLPELAAQAIVLTDGVLTHGIERLPGNVELESEADEARLSEWESRLARADLAEAHSFARLTGTLTLRLRCAAEAPIVLVNVVTGGEHGWRLVIDGAANAQARICLVHLHLAPARASCGIEVHADTNAHIDVDEIELGSDGPGRVGQHFVSREFQLGRDAQVRWNTATAGGALSRHLSWAHLNAPGAHVALVGIKALAADQQGHDLIRVFHHAGNATSDQFFKTVVDDESIASFDGVIHVDPGADGTDAMQNSNNLQLSQKARVATRPQLDIYADEVSASHGATVGQPDADEIRYLATRGIAAALARSLIITGAIQEGLDRLHLPAARQIAERLLLGNLRRA